MSITVVDRNYITRNHPTGNGFLLGNTGQIIEGDSIDIVCEFDFQSTMSKQILIVAVNQIRILGGLWSKMGYVVGDNVLIYGTVNASTVTNFGGLSLNIEGINGDTMTLSGSLDINVTFTMAGQSMPSQAGSSSNTSMGIKNNSRSMPKTFEIYHNLILNSQTSGIGSLLDGEVNKFRFDGVDGLIVGGTVTGVQQGNKSGGSYTFYEVERLADVSATNWTFTVTTNKSYRITLKYANGLKFEDSDFGEPSWYANNETLKPFYRFNGQSEANNPNSIITGDYSGLLGNIGWRDENYNQGVNQFTVSTVITDAALNPLAEIDFSQPCIVTATITHPSQDFLEAAEVEFYLIPDLNLVKNKPDRNCDLIQLSNFFVDSTPTITAQVFGTGGAEIVTSAQTLNVATANTMIVQFTLTPNSAFTSLIDSFSSLSRRYVITANVESTGGTTNENNAVSLTLKQGILELSPVVGSPYPVREQSFFNHANLITGTPESTYKGCTEDDFMYKALFNFTEGDIWNGMRLKIQVVRDSDSQAFDLVSKPINLSNYVITPNGQIQINYNETINQFLEAPERNQLKVNLTGVSVAGEYEVQILWSLMASWRDWLAQSNAFVDFFDNTLPNNGMNAEWMRYLREVGYSLRVRVELIDSANTAFYFGAGIELQDYEDTPDVTTEFEYYNSSGVQQTSWILGDIMTVKAIHTNLSGTWDTMDTWGWTSIRPEYNEPNKRISTVWDWTAQSYPLLPPIGETKATLTFTAPNVAVVECRVNTVGVSPDSTPVARIESPIDPICVSPIDYLFDQIVNSTDSDSGYPLALATFLENGILAKNICCPTCETTNVDTGLDDNVYAFTGNAVNIIPPAPYSGEVPCCTDSYGTITGCSLTFDLEWDNFMVTLVGENTAALTALVPRQINAYSGASLTLIIAKLQAITSNISIQYKLMKTLLELGFKVICYNDGTKTISAV